MSNKPVIVTTWKFGLAASRKGWSLLQNGSSALDAIEAAGNVTELDETVNSVGYGGLPNSDGVVELDAAIMDGATHSAGSVGGLQGIKTPISVARRIMECSSHVMLVGENAKQFALHHGFNETNLLTPLAEERWQAWKLQKDGADVAHFDLGPREGLALPAPIYTPDNHDTIGLCALDAAGNLAVGCTTSGMSWKTPGRVGDSPIIGSGLYVDNEVGGAAATGHGDEMMKACLSFVVVEAMRLGMTPEEACIHALRYLMKKRPPRDYENYGAALIAVRKDGMYGGASTRTGFASPDRLWTWAHGNHANSECMLHEGPYVTDTDMIRSL